MRFCTMGLFAAAAVVAAGQAKAVDVPLSGTGHTGYLSFSGLQTEQTEPKTPGGKDFDYPYYLNTNYPLYDMVVAEPLSADSVYAEEAANTVLGKTITDADFGDSSFGSISYDGLSLTGVGSETVSVSADDVTLDLTMFSPLYSPRNIDNEFAWDYVVETQSLASPSLDLSFTEGALTGIDGELEIGVSVRFLGSIAFQDGAGGVLTYDGTLVFSGGDFEFDVEVVQDAVTALGPVTDTWLVFNRSGGISAVVPEPASLALASLASTVALGAVRSRRR